MRSPIAASTYAPCCERAKSFHHQDRIGKEIQFSGSASSGPAGLFAKERGPTGRGQFWRNCGYQAGGAC